MVEGEPSVFEPSRAGWGFLSASGRRPPLLWQLALIFLGIAGCQQSTAVWIEPGSTAENLVFRISSQVDGGRKIFLDYLLVHSIEGRGSKHEKSEAVWGMRFDSGVVNYGYIQRVRYGEIPFAYTGKLLKKIEPGYYRVQINGTGYVGFEVSSTGQVVQKECEDWFGQILRFFLCIYVFFLVIYNESLRISAV